VFSIHQPSLKAFLKFDQILLMSRSAGKEYGGQQLFLGSPSEAVRYFRSMAANDQSNIFPEDLSEQLTNAGTPGGLMNTTFENPAEFLLDVSSIDSPSGLLQIAEMFQKHADINNTNPQGGARRQQAISTCRPFQRASGGVAFWMLTQRNIRNVIRDPLLLIGHMVVTAAISAALALFGANMALDFLGVQTRVFLFNFLVLFFSMVATSSMGALIQERSVFIRERAAHFYPSWCYCCSKLLCDLVPLRSLPPMLLTYTVYWSVGLRDDDTAFVKFLVSLLMANYSAASCCQLISALCRDVGQANLFAAAYVIYSFIFSGMLLTGGNQAALDVRYTSIFFYPWEAMCGGEFGTDADFNFNPEINGQPAIPSGSTGKYPNGMPISLRAILDNFHLQDRFAFDITILALCVILFAGSSIAILTLSKFAK